MAAQVPAFAAAPLHQAAGAQGNFLTMLTNPALGNYFGQSAGIATGALNARVPLLLVAIATFGQAMGPQIAFTLFTLILGAGQPIFQVSRDSWPGAWGGGKPIR